MSREVRDLTGQQFGRLKVIKYSPRKTKGSGAAQWVCECGCGRFLIVRGDNLRDGRTTQCTDCKGEDKGGMKSIFVEGFGEEDDDDATV